jgi:O-antigen ligase/tetratricopeptide (TPR) repeat protein
VTLVDARDWARRLTAAEWAALAAGVVVFGYVGWDSALWDARLQLVLHLVAIGAIAGLGLIALRGGLLPRTRIDVPVLALLAAFALATVSALNVGMSLRAMAAVVGTAAMLPVALIALRQRPAWVGILTSVPVLALSIPTLAVLLFRRVEWVVVGAPGLPPLRLPGEGTPFGSVAVPPFVIWPAWALAGLIEPPGVRRWVRIGLVAVGVPLTILSGSRSAWLAMAVTGAVVVVPWAWANRDRLRIGPIRSARALALWLGAGAVVLVTAALVIPRLTAVTSLLYRASLWRDTLAAWASDPLLGIGPGFMPYARQAAAPDFSFPVRQPHSHNLPLGVLGDAGLIGLAAAAILVVSVAMVAGPWRARTPVGRAAATVLLGLGVAGLFEDITFLPNFNLLAICLLAAALSDAGAVRWVRFRTTVPLRWVAVATGTGAGVMLLAAMVTSDAGALAYRSGATAADEGRMVDAADRFARAVEIDPWHPAGPKALAVAADAAGEATIAREAADDATGLNPGDGPSWVNLALLCADDGDAGCQARATERAVATASFQRTELVNAAFGYETLELPSEADDAYRRSLLSQLLTTFGTEWPRVVAIGSGAVDDVTGAQVELNRLVAWWAMDEPIDPSQILDPATRALAHGMLGERSDAEMWLERAIEEHPAEIPTWDAAIVLRDHWGLDIEDELRIAEVVRGRPFPPREPSPELPRLTFDIASFRAYPRDALVESAIRLRPDPTYPWVLETTFP